MSLEINNAYVSRELVKRTVLKTIRSKIEEINFKLIDTRKMLTYYEKKYGMQTDYFYERFIKGNLGDEQDFFEWKALKEIHDELIDEKKILLEAIK